MLSIQLIFLSTSTTCNLEESLKALKHTKQNNSNNNIKSNNIESTWYFFQGFLRVKDYSEYYINYIKYCTECFEDNENITR